MRLNEYARRNGITYRTAYSWWRKGFLKGRQVHTGTIFIEEEDASRVEVRTPPDSACIYARVSNAQNKDNLESQAERLRQFCNAKGYVISKVIKEIGSGINDRRPKLLKLLGEEDFSILVVEHEDRLARVGANYIRRLLSLTHRRLEVVNQAEDDGSDIMQDFVSIVTSFCAKIYGLRRSRRKTERIIREVMENAQEEA